MSVHATKRKTKQSASSPFPLKPMLATRAEEPFNHPDWIYEVKFDGYRIISEVKEKKAHLLSRGQLDYTNKYPPVSEVLSRIDHEAVFDGEVIVIGEDSKPSFNLLQHYRKRYKIIYYLFDLLWLDGKNFMKNPLIERRKILSEILPQSDILKFSEDFEDGIALFAQLKEMGMEGIVAKKKDSLYYPGKRVESWVKIPVTIHQDFVIGGWAESGSGKLFRSLLFGNYQDGKLIYIHHAGGGFNDKEMSILLSKLKEKEINENPFANKINDIETKIHWVRPEFVGEFKISNKKSPSGKIRHPAIFVRLRNDKNPKEIVPETIIQKPLEPEKNVISSYRVHNNHDSSKQANKALKEKVEINGHELILTNLEKNVWENITKAELFNFYHTMWEYISPYLKDRPLGLHANPFGAKGPDKWIRNIDGKHPAWVETFKTERKHKKPGKGNFINWLICNNEATLFYMVNLDCIDLHPWSSRTVSINYPDYLVIDLDPSDNDFQKVTETAKAADDFLKRNKIIAFLKTSGKTGMHILIPVTGIPFGDSRKISENIAREIHKLVPDFTTLSVSVNERGERVYIDPSQNDYSDRIAAPYSLRAYNFPLISTPLLWEEIYSDITPDMFNIKTIFKRLKKKGDLLEGLLKDKNRKHNEKVLVHYL